MVFKLISILKALKQSEKTENDISCILLTFSCLVPMLSVLQIYNKQRSKLFESPYSGQFTLF